MTLLPLMHAPRQAGICAPRRPSSGLGILTVACKRGSFRIW
jgi:hypothetical protein